MTCACGAELVPPATGRPWSYWQGGSPTHRHEAVQEPSILPPLPDDLPDDMTLGEAREWLRERMRDGAACPCCEQRAQIYRRSINSGMAVSLIRMWRAAGLDWQHIPTTIPAHSREEGKLRYWGLVEEAAVERDDGGRAGWWRVTPEGEAFVFGRVALQKYALVYDSRCLGFEGDTVTIAQCLGERFNLRELLHGDAA